MDTKAMTAERLAQIDAALVEGGEYVGTENEMTHTDGVTALNFAWELLSEVHRLRAVEEKAKVLHKGLRKIVLLTRTCELCSMQWTAKELAHQSRCPAAPSFLESGT